MSEWTANFDGTDPLMDPVQTGLDQASHWVHQILALPHLRSPLLRECLESFGKTLGLSRLVLRREERGKDRLLLTLDLEPQGSGPRGASLALGLSRAQEPLGELLLFRWPSKGGFSPLEERLIQLVQDALATRFHQDLLEAQVGLLQRQLPHIILPQLRQARRLETLGEMTVGLAHDLNNILTTVLGQTQMALSELPPQHVCYTPLNSALQAGKQASQLSQGLLSFVRGRNLPKTRLHLGPFLRDLRPFLLSLLGKEIPLELEIESELPAVLADRSRLKQALLNLVINAKQALQGQGVPGSAPRAGGRLRIQARWAAAKNRVLLSIEDNGPGISLELQKRIFDPFFSTKNAKTGGQGTGLGLPTVAAVLQEHGGEIEVQSEPGAGCRFILTLPVSSTYPQSSGKGRPGSSEPTGS